MAISVAGHKLRDVTEPGLQARPNLMIRIHDLLVLTPKIAPTEASLAVWAAWHTDTAGLAPRFSGYVVGPFCPYASTLSARTHLQFHTQAETKKLRASATILEPCYWEPTHPFAYRVHLEWVADTPDQSGSISFNVGVRHLSVTESGLVLNGQQTFLTGVRHGRVESVNELEAWHAAGCNVFLSSAGSALYEHTDEYGPIVLHVLPTMKEEARDEVVRLRNHPSLLMWVLPQGIPVDTANEWIEMIRKLDPSRPIGELISNESRAQRESAAAVHFLLTDLARPTVSPTRPCIPVHAAPRELSPQAFGDLLREHSEAQGPQIVGWIA